MHLPLVVPLLLATLLACTRQEAASDSVQEGPPSGRAAAGDVVTELPRAVFHVHHAKDSAHWFGSDGQGAYRYDGTELVRFTTEHGLGGDRIRGIREDRSGNLFVCAERGGVSRFDGRVFHTLTPLGASESEWKLGPDDLWFPGSQDSGVVYRWDGTSLHELAFPRTDAGEAHVAAFPRSTYPAATYSPYDVYTIFEDGRGHLWFGTAVLGACRFDGTSFEWVGHGENGSFGVRSVVEERNGTFWLSNALRRFTEDAGAATTPGTPRYRREPGIATDGDPYAVFLSSVRDEHGALWIATLGNGVFRYDGTAWTHFPVTHDGESIWVYSIQRDRQGVLWLGTHEHGAYRLAGTTFEKFEL